MSQMKRSNKLMWYAIVFLSIVLVIAIYFNIPFSKTRSEFNSIVNEIIPKTDKNRDNFSEDDIRNLPLPVQKYFRNSGFIGTKKMSYIKAYFKNVDFKMSADKTIQIDYTQYNFIDKPERAALIDSSLYGIPFEGLDSYINGVGSMKGSLAKAVTLFNQRGENMNKACLVTILAECIFAPNIALQDYIKWEGIDETHAKATISYYGISAGGIFTFNENGEMLSFKTKDRVATTMDGTAREAEWSAIILDYQIVNGIKQPKVVQSIWHYPEGDMIYFNENKSPVTIEYH